MIGVHLLHTRASMARSGARFAVLKQSGTPSSKNAPWFLGTFVATTDQATEYMHLDSTVVQFVILIVHLCKSSRIL